MFLMLCVLYLLPHTALPVCQHVGLFVCISVFLEAELHTCDDAVGCVNTGNRSPYCLKAHV